MLFDSPAEKKTALRPKLRLAATENLENESLQSKNAIDNNNISKIEITTSLLDKIDAFTKTDSDQSENDGEFPRSQHDRFNYENQQNAYAPQGGNNWQANQGSAAPLVHPIYVLNAVKNWRNVILATSILGGLIGVGIAASTPKLYYSSTGILIDPRNFRVVENDINPDVFLSEASLAIVDSQLNVMRSPAVVDKVAAKLNLENDEEFNGTRKGLLSPIKDFISILSGEKSEGTKLGTTLKNLNKKTDVERQNGTFVVNIGAFSEDPEKAALIANTYVEVYLAERAMDRTGTADRTSNAMEARLPELKKQVEVAENKAARFKAENDLFDAQGRLIDDEVILRLNDQLSTARSETITLNARADSAKEVTVDGLLANGLPEEINSNALNSLRAQYTSAKQRYDGLQSKLGPMHPDLQQAENEGASLRMAIENEIKRIRSAIQTELRRAVQTEQALAKSLAEMKAKLAKSGEAFVQLREIEREAASARTVYEQFLLRAQETGEQGAIDSTNIKRTNVAKPALESTGTSRKLIALLGVIGGFVLGLGLAILAGILDALKVQYGGNLGTSRPSAPAPNPQSSAKKRSIRGTFVSANSAPRGSNPSPIEVPEQQIVVQKAPAPAVPHIVPVAENQPQRFANGRQNQPRQNSQLDEIQESLAEVKAQLLSLAKQRRLG